MFDLIFCSCRLCGCRGFLCFRGFLSHSRGVLGLVWKRLLAKQRHNQANWSKQKTGACINWINSGAWFWLGGTCGTWWNMMKYDGTLCKCMSFLRFNEGCSDPYRRKIPCKSKHPFPASECFVRLGSSSLKENRHQAICNGQHRHKKGCTREACHDHEDKKKMPDQQTKPNQVRSNRGHTFLGPRPSPRKNTQFLISKRKKGHMTNNKVNGNKWKTQLNCMTVW